MDSIYLAAYNFLAIKANVKTYNSVTEYNNAIADNSIDKRFVPYFSHHIVNVNDKQILSTVLSSRYGFEWFKVAGNVVTGHYRKFITKPGITFESYDLTSGIKTGEHTASRNGITSNLDVNNGVVTMGVTFSHFSHLPEDFKNRLTDYEFKDYVFGYINAVEEVNVDSIYVLKILLQS